MPHYLNAPILEAVLDLRVAVPDGLVIDLDVIVARVKADFPVQETAYAVQGEIQVAKDAQIVVSSQHSSGHQLRDENNTKVLQIMPNGFTFSKLPPYDRWESFSTEARRSWNQYKSEVTGLSIKRVGLRYISRIDYPKLGKLGDYLNIRPLLPQELPNNDVIGFFLQAQLPQPDINAYLIINETAAEPSSPEHKSIVLDIDLYSEQNWDGSDDAPVWDLLEKMRLRKNDVFEAAITDKTRELIK